MKRVYFDLRDVFFTICKLSRHSAFGVAFMDYNRIKVVLAEKKKTSLWLAEQLQKSAQSVSKWCTNQSQPSVETLFSIAEVLDVDVRELLVSTKKS